MSDFKALEMDILKMLVGVNRYNPQNLEKLESYVDAQITQNGYDPETNFTTLKLYQLNPDKWNVDVAVKIILKTLMVLPQADTVLAKAVIDSGNIELPQIKEVLNLSYLLETCQFTKFWDARREENMAKKIAPYVGFDASIRDFISHVVSISYQNIKKEKLREILGMSNDQDLEKHASAVGWEIKSDGYVFVCNQEATVKTKNIEEKIELINIKDILRAAA